MDQDDYKVIIDFSGSGAWIGMRKPTPEGAGTFPDQKKKAGKTICRDKNTQERYEY